MKSCKMNFVLNHKWKIQLVAHSWPPSHFLSSKSVDGWPCLSTAGPGGFNSKGEEWFLFGLVACIVRGRESAAANVSTSSTQKRI